MTWLQSSQLLQNSICPGTFSTPPSPRPMGWKDVEKTLWGGGHKQPPGFVPAVAAAQVYAGNFGACV